MRATDRPSPDAMDRRSILRKAAAAGAIAWAAPTVISTDASAADGAFTPKCQATRLDSFENFSFWGRCTGQGANWWARVAITVLADCPCSTPDVDVEGPTEIGALTLKSKSSSPDFALGGTEFIFRYQGSTAETEVLYSPVFFSVVRCSDRAGDEKEFREPVPFPPGGPLGSFGGTCT